MLGEVSQLCYQHQPTFYTIIKTPYKVLFGRDPVEGLAFRFPEEIDVNVTTGEDLNQ